MNMKKLTNYEFLKECKRINENYKKVNDGNPNATPLFSDNFVKFLDECIKEVEDSGATKNKKVSNAIINNHLRGLN